MCQVLCWVLGVQQCPEHANPCPPGVDFQRGEAISRLIKLFPIMGGDRIRSLDRRASQAHRVCVEWMKVGVGGVEGQPCQGDHESPLEEVIGRRVGGWEYSGHREQPCKGPVVDMSSEHLENRKLSDWEVERADLMSLFLQRHEL